MTCFDIKKFVLCNISVDNFTFRCKILDSHLSTLAQKHLETRFIKLNVEKAPFLTQRLGIRVIPTMGLVKDGKTQVKISHGSGDFHVELLLIVNVK